MIAVVSQHINTAPVAASWHQADLPRALDVLIERLLEKAPDEPRASRPCSMSCSGSQRVVDDNAALRALARRGAEAIAGDSAQSELRDALDSLARGSDTSVRLSELSTANGELRAAIARLGAPTQDLALRAAILSHLRAEADARSFALMGPRADG